MRVEHDFLGEMELEDANYYGIQTARGVAASQVTGRTYGQEARALIDALARIKKAAALANCRVGGLDRDRAGAIARAADEVLKGRWYSQFPVDLITGGGGVSLHMNMNEVLARRASELLEGVEVHPNTHVNMGQSTNDVLPSAMLLTTHQRLLEVRDAVRVLRRSVSRRAEELSDVVKLGRTCLQDAVPVTVGQELSGWSSFLARQEGALERCAGDCLVLPLGGAAVGTGAGCLPGYVREVYHALWKICGLPVRPAENLFDSMQNADGYIRVSAALKALAAGVSKMASDLRLMSSGPRGGLGELVLPAVLPGSSIMPGKSNPVLPELMIQIYFLVCGNDAAVTLAAERGELELNVWEAVLSKCTMESCRLLSRGLPLFAKDCIDGLRVREDHCRRQAEASTAAASVIAAVFGYEAGSRVARDAIQRERTVREIAVEQGLLDEETARRLLDPSQMTDGGAMARAISALRETLDRASGG